LSEGLTPPLIGVTSFHAFLKVVKELTFEDEWKGGKASTERLDNPLAMEWGWLIILSVIQKHP